MQYDFTRTFYFGAYPTFVNRSPRPVFGVVRPQARFFFAAFSQTVVQATLCC